MKCKNYLMFKIQGLATSTLLNAGGCSQLRIIGVGVANIWSGSVVWLTKNDAMKE